jgi:hypothetical protein
VFVEKLVGGCADAVHAEKGGEVVASFKDPRV